MNFEQENIVEANCWTFGMFAKKNGNVDYKQLKEDLKQIEYYIAAISLETVDGEYFARLSQSFGYKWLFENLKNDKEDCSKIFKDFTSGSVFERFSEHAPEVIKRGFDTLFNILKTSPEKFKENGIDQSKIESLVGMAPAILKKVDSAFSRPILKNI